MRTTLTAMLLWMGLVLPRATMAQEDLENEIKDMDRIGFQQFDDVSRVFVRTTEPAKYKVQTPHPKQVVLFLENTRVPVKNNTRALDTRYFDSPVYRIEPTVIEDPSPSVRIVITLRKRASFKTLQQDNVLALDFARIQEQQPPPEQSEDASKGEDAE